MAYDPKQARAVLGSVADTWHGDIVKTIEQYSTERLLARRVCWADFEDAQRLHSDPRVARTFSAKGEPLSEETTRRMIRRAILHWRTHGFGLWMFRSRETGEFIGRGGLIRHSALDMGEDPKTPNSAFANPGSEQIGLAYAVLSSHWGQGYATEMGDASLSVGFHHLGFESIAAWTLPSNLASQRVLAKLGFRYECNIIFAGLPHVFFRLDRRDYQPQCGRIEAATRRVFR